MLKFPENNSRFSWTRHIKNKMVFYNLSGNYLLRIFSNPERREEGIAPGTIGAMKTVKHHVKTAAVGAPQKKRETEVWIMYKLAPKGRRAIRNTYNATRHSSEEPSLRKAMRVKQSAVTLISAWRYPGKTKVGERPPIPEGLMEELTEEGLIS